MTSTIRSARVADARQILMLVNQLALKQVMLPRDPTSVIEMIRDFSIAEIDGRFVGCGALHITWSDICEIRSLAVDECYHGRGIGRAIVEHLITDAKRLGLPRVFVFTYAETFFHKQGFRIVEHESLPQKVFSDCVHCPKFTACDEIAMERVLDPNATIDILTGLPRRAGPPLPQPGPGRRKPSSPIDPPVAKAKPNGPDAKLSEPARAESNEPNDR